MVSAQQQAEDRKPTPVISSAAAWAFSLGSAIGWGSLVVTSRTYLSQAGPAGSVLGLLIGAVMMLVISRNYAYLMNITPGPGGAYTWVSNIFGADHGFLASWFLMLTYLAILWANVTSLPLFANYFVGGIFRFGYLYSLFGYDVYLGETLLSIAGLLVFTWLCGRGRKLVSGLMIVLAAIFTGGILLCFAAAMMGLDRSLLPAYLPDSAAAGQILQIACISPWAFIGFENVSHLAEEFRFPVRKSGRVLNAGVITATVLYAAILILSVSAYPDRYGSWLEYIRDLSNCTGMEALPPFYAAQHYLGSFGIAALMLSLLALVITSLIGQTTALSRLFRAMALDGVISPRFAELNRREVPGKAIALVAGISVLVPLVGRTAIGWIVDVTTIGATVVYGFVSAAALKQARFQRDKIEQGTGILGVIFTVAIGAYLLIPNLFTTGTLEAESYFLFAIWAILGFLFFRQLLRRDQAHKYGNSIVVWIALLSLILFVSLVWMSQTTMRVTAEAMDAVQAEYAAQGFDGDMQEMISGQLQQLRSSNARSILIVLAMFGVSLGVLINNYTWMTHRARTSEEQLGQVRTMANTDPLTGVKSKHAWAEAEKQWESRVQEGKAEPFAVVICDVNNLKAVNDTLGHQAGDEYICRASQMICKVFAHSPVYRTGGDEFVVLMSGEDYENRAELMAGMHHQAEENQRTGGVVIAAGIADYDPSADDSLRAVFRRADERMYQRKKQLKAGR